MSATKSKRIVGLDFLRSALMLLGIPYHAGLIFSGYWIYTSSAYQGTNIFSYLSSTSHVFRMQLFFLLAGFFTQLVMDRKGVDHFIKSRVNRVFIPFFVFYMAYSVICLAFSDMEPFWRRAFLGHFWFVYVLMAYTAITVIMKHRLRLLTHMKLPVFALISIVCVYLSYYLKKDDFVFSCLFAYLPYFLLGFMLYEQKDTKQITLGYTSVSIGLFMLLFGLQFYVARYVKDMPLAGLADHAISFLTPFPLIIFLFYFFYNLDMKPSKTVDIIVKSSFTVYLLHHPFIVIYSYLLNEAHLHVILFYLSIVLLTGISCFMIYFTLKMSNRINRLLALS